jgi:hypothetical protein
LTELCRNVHPSGNDPRLDQGCAMRPGEAMSGLPSGFGRTVYAEIDEEAGPEPLAQAARWLARLEPWFGPCRSVGVVARAVEGTRATVVSAGHDGDRAVLVHLATPRPAGVGTRLKVEGAGATLQVVDGSASLTCRGGSLDPAGIELPEVDLGRSVMLNDALARALASREVATVDG